MIYTNWGTGQPDKHEGDGKDCAYYDGQTGGWAVSDCDETFASICEQPVEIVELPEEPDGCSEVHKTVFTKK